MWHPDNTLDGDELAEAKREAAKIKALAAALNALDHVDDVLDGDSGQVQIAIANVDDVLSLRIKEFFERYRNDWSTFV